MGGKSKKAERTKDNARPSSSSHCAELLGNNIPIFCDFSTEAFFGAPEESSCNIDTNFQLALKKMSKKDSVTKLKALQEFTDLCRSSHVETIKAILPFWPRLYCSLATDTEHRVREASHVAHGAIVEKMKKSIAPYLKQLAGPWFTSQYDNYPPAASAAVSAFERAFPPEKQNKVITFCQEEILNYIYESLIKHTPQTLSNPKITKPEEMEAKYQRIVIASLQGYNLYLQKLSCDQIKEAEESNRKILSSPKFWDYSKNKVPLIRNSFFSVLISLCQNAKFLLANEMKRVTVAIFSNLDDSDPMVMACVWDSALNALVFLDDCWSHVNFEKQFFPKLNNIIRKGGRNAITIFPSMLPLLSKIPQDLIKDNNLFYGTILENMSYVMDASVSATTTTTTTSFSDAKTLASTFMECFKYIVVRFESDASFCTSLVSNHLLKALEKRLSAAKSSSSPVTAILFSETSKLLRYWQSNSSATNAYGEMLRVFWESLTRIYDSGLNSVGVLGDVVANHVALTSMLHNPRKYAPNKPKRRLKFAEDKGDGDEVDDDNGGGGGGGDDDDDEEEFKRQMLTFAKRVAVSYLTKSIVDRTNACIPALNHIVKLLDSRAVLEELLASVHGTAMFSLFSNLFSPWIESPDMRCGELVELSFSLLRYIRTEEKESLLRKFCEDWTDDDLRYDVCRALLNHSGDESVRAWITGEGFSNRLVGLTRAFIDSDADDPVAHNIVATFFKAKDVRGDFIIGSETASSVVDLVSSSIRSSSDDKEHVRKLAQTLAENHTETCRRSLENLVVALFKSSCYHASDEELVRSCGSGLRRVVESEGLARKLADAVVEIIMSDDAPAPMDDVVSRIKCFADVSPGAVKHFAKEPAAVKTWRRRIRRSALVAYQSLGEWDLRFVEIRDGAVPEMSASELPREVSRLLAEYRDCDEDDPVTSDMMVKFARWNVYVGSLMNATASQDDDVLSEVLDFVHSVGVLVSFGNHFASTKFYPDLKKHAKALKRIGQEFLPRVAGDVLHRACEVLAREDPGWRMMRPVLRDLFSRDFAPEEPTEDASRFLESDLSSATELLKLSYALDRGDLGRVSEEQWSKVFIRLHKAFDNSEDLLSLSIVSRITLRLLKRFEENHSKPPDERLCPEACLAWSQVVRGELWKSFFDVWHRLAETWHDGDASPEVLVAVQSVSEVVMSVADCRQCEERDVVKMAVKYGRYISSQYTVFQMSSFHLLRRLVPDFVKVDTATFCDNLSKITEDGSSFKTSKCDWTCRHLEKVIARKQGIVETLLSDFVIGDCCSVEPFTDSFNYTYSYLLVWCFLLEMCGEAHSSLRFQYGFWLRDAGYARSLLDSVFKLMPQSVVHGSDAKDNCVRFFEAYASEGLGEPVTSSRIERVSCYVYRLFLQRLPNVVREWWSQSENKTSSIVDKVTSLYVSPILIANELKSVQQDREGGFDNMEIKTHANAREVVATYTIDEVKMDLVMTLPQDYPLGTIKIESSNAVVSSSSRRNWLFHISKYLIHQNGTIWEALVMWKNNLDKKFEGIEECYICASILRGSAFETPRVCCKICKKKFHSHCLYKWFSTSNNSSCPICRNLF